MAMYRIELGEFSKGKKCDCCNKKFSVAHGFIYKNEIPYAVYYAGLKECYDFNQISFVISLGEWLDGSTVNDRLCFGLNIYIGENNLEFSFVDPDRSPWPNSPLLGPVQSREKALKSNLKKEVFNIIEFVLDNDSNIRNYVDSH